MFPTTQIKLVLLLLSLFRSSYAAQDQPPICKASPGSSDWPTLSQWTALNSTISGRLLKPSPPGAVCHPDQPTYNSTQCPSVLSDWFTMPFQVGHPIANAWNNWNNDSCLPTATSPCSGDGYPVYVINATCKEDVKAGVDFAREHNVRLNVKSTGHDYMGRFVHPNRLLGPFGNSNKPQISFSKLTFDLDSPPQRDFNFEILQASRL